ncbi:MAG: radical SAM protein [Deltaproteobacteria bacterium]|nr:radical SAM protein [Deltaproteobacteria bacterium]
MPHVLCVNPWIYDFAAYDFWAKPVGLLLLAAIMRKHGIRVSYIDCLDRFHPSIPPSDPQARYGRGPYLKTEVPRPAGFFDVNRRYSRYGIATESLARDLDTLPRPDLIFVTSHMTYWYPGVVDTIKMVKSAFPGVPVILGGIYATLCHEHAVAVTGADEVVSGTAISHVMSLVEKYTGRSIPVTLNENDMNTWPHPAHDLQAKIAYVPLLTSVGCPFSCDYCASGLLAPHRMEKSVDAVIDEIRFWHTGFGVHDFVFYDDALLLHPEDRAEPLFEAIAGLGYNLRLHTPNAVHIRWITKRLALLMEAAGMESLRLGLETTQFDHRKMDHKVGYGEFLRASAYLKEAGFGPDRVGAYLLFGLPGQTIESMEPAIDFVKQAGIKPILAHYTPIPGTPMWEDAVAASRYDLESDPVYTNNAVMPCRQQFDWALISRLKKRIMEK